MGYSPKPIMEDIRQGLEVIDKLMELGHKKGSEVEYDMAIKLVDDIKKSIERLPGAINDDKKAMVANKEQR